MTTDDFFKHIDRLFSEHTKQLLDAQQRQHEEFLAQHKAEATSLINKVMGIGEAFADALFRSSEDDSDSGSTSGAIGGTTVTPKQEPQGIAKRIAPRDLSELISKPKPEVTPVRHRNAFRR